MPKKAYGLIVQISFVVSLEADFLQPCQVRRVLEEDARRRAQIVVAQVQFHQPRQIRRTNNLLDVAVL